MLRCDFKADPRARRSLKKQVHHHPAAQCVQTFEALVFERLKITGAVENGFNLRPAKFLDAKKSAAHVCGYTLSQSRTFSMPSISRNFTSMISASAVCTMRPI